MTATGGSGRRRRRPHLPGGAGRQARPSVPARTPTLRRPWHAHGRRTDALSASGGSIGASRELRQTRRSTPTPRSRSMPACVSRQAHLALALDRSRRAPRAGPCRAPRAGRCRRPSRSSARLERQVAMRSWAAAWPSGVIGRSPRSGTQQATTGRASPGASATVPIGRPSRSAISDWLAPRRRPDDDAPLVRRHRSAWSDERARQRRSARRPGRRPAIAEATLRAEGSITPAASDPPWRRRDSDGASAKSIDGPVARDSANRRRTPTVGRIGRPVARSRRTRPGPPRGGLAIAQEPHGGPERQVGVAVVGS